MWEEGFVNYCSAHDTVNEWGVECPVCEAERDNQRRINADTRAAKSATDTALYRPYNSINNEEHLK